MLKITKRKDETYDIELTRGDTLTMEVGLFRKIPPVPPDTEPTFEPYEPVEGDSLRFAVSKGYKGASGYELKLSKDIPLDTLTFTCSSQETELDYETYNFDVEITHDDGTVDTFIEGKIKIVGEAE